MAVRLAGSCSFQVAFLPVRLYGAVAAAGRGALITKLVAEVGIWPAAGESAQAGVGGRAGKCIQMNDLGGCAGICATGGASGGCTEVVAVLGPILVGNRVGTKKISKNLQNRLHDPVPAAIVNQVESN